MSKGHSHKPILVVDIGSYSIKFISGKRSVNGVTIKSAQAVPISSNIYMNGDLQNIQELSSVVKDYIRENGFKHHVLMLTFGSTSTIARVLEVPAVKSEELKDIVEYEMQQYLPADQSLFNIQFKLLNESASGKEGTRLVMAGTVPKITADNFWSMVQQCDIVPLGLDIHTNALTKLIETATHINSFEDIKNETVALVEIGHQLMDISLFEKGVFQFNRRIVLGGLNMDQRIERLLGITLEEARVEKHNRIDINQEVFEYTDENRVLNALKTGVDEWVSEIEKVFKYHKSRKVGNHIGRCFIYGGGSGIVGIDSYMGNILGVQTEVIHDLGNISIDSSVDKTRLPLFINGIGAMIRKEEQK